MKRSLLQSQLAPSRLSWLVMKPPYLNKGYASQPVGQQICPAAHAVSQVKLMQSKKMVSIQFNHDIVPSSAQQPLCSWGQQACNTESKELCQASSRQSNYVTHSSFQAHTLSSKASRPMPARVMPSASSCFSTTFCSNTYTDNHEGPSLCALFHDAHVLTWQRGVLQAYAGAPSQPSRHAEWIEGGQRAQTLHLQQT